MAVIAVVGALSSYLEKYLTTSVGQWVMHDLRRTLYHHIHRLSLAEHDEKRTGDLIGRVTSDIEAIQSFITTALLGILTNVLTLLGIVGVMLYLNWRFTLISLAIAPVLFLVVYFFTRRIKKASRDVRKKAERAGFACRRSFLLDPRGQGLCPRGLRGAPLRAPEPGKCRDGPGCAKHQDEALACRRDYRGDRDLLDARLRRAPGAGGPAHAGALVVFLLYLGKMYKPMRELAKMTDTVSNAAVGFERIREVLETESGVRDLPHARRAARFKGKIEFDKVSFGYNQDQLILKDVSFQIEPGQVAAFVGPTGGGKSTIISLVARFYDPVSGEVKIDGTDIRNYTMKSLRQQISFVLQETLLFHAPIWENIAYGRPEANRAEIIHAAKLANAHEFIEQDARGLRHDGRRARRDAFRGPAPAHRHRAGGDPQYSHSGSGRAHIRTGRSVRASRVRSPGPFDGRQDFHRHRAPPGDDPARQHYLRGERQYSR